MIDVRLSVQKRHRREVWLQIVLPCLLFSALIITVASLVVVTAQTNASLWASMAIILLIIPLGIFMFTILIILGGLVFGVTKVMDWLPRSMAVVQKFFSMITYESRRFCDKSVAPILHIAGWNSAVRTAGRIPERIISSAPHVPSSPLK